MQLLKWFSYLTGGTALVLGVIAAGIFISGLRGDKGDAMITYYLFLIFPLTCLGAFLAYRAAGQIPSAIRTAMIFGSVALASVHWLAVYMALSGFIGWLLRR